MRMIMSYLNVANTSSIDFDVEIIGCDSGFVIPSSIKDQTFFLDLSSTEVVKFDSFAFSLAANCGAFEYALICPSCSAEITTLDMNQRMIKFDLNSLQIGTELAISLQGKLTDYPMREGWVDFNVKIYSFEWKFIPDMTIELMELPHKIDLIFD